jgi:uncharacterized damage-inducible protein DinB
MVHERPRMDLLDRLLGHDHWTTAQFLALSRGLTDAQLDQEFDIGHQTVRATFEHMSSVVEFWTAVMTGQPVDGAGNGPGEGRSLAALLDHHERAYATFAAFARQVRDEQRLEDTFVDEPVTLGSTILHVILHNAQHRGEALHLLERLGVPDLPEGNPLDWELATQGS